jgi:peptidyl-dipeptidase Dcp
MIPALLLALFTTAVAADVPETPVETNPFFAQQWDTPFGVPPLDRIENEHYLPAFEAGIRRHDAEIKAIVDNPLPASFDNTMGALEQSGRILERTSTAFYARRAAHTNDGIKELAKQVAPLLSAHYDDMMFNKELFARIDALFLKQDMLDLNAVQLHLLTETHRDFTRGGIALPDDDQNRIREINSELSTLSTEFDEALLAETNDFFILVDDKKDLGDLPASLVAAAATEAEGRGEAGKWAFTLSRPSINPFLQYSPNAQLRQRLFDGYAMRGDNNNQNDNKARIARMVVLRAEKAKLLGYDSHAHLVLSDNMAKNPEAALKLVKQVWKPAVARAQKEAKDLAKLKKKDSKEAIVGADWRFYTERLRKERYALEDDALRPYFEVNAVRDGAFAVANKLFGLTFEQREDLPVWHEDQQVFEVKEADGTHVGILYMDFFTRESKRGGAWMNALRSQSTLLEATPVVTNNFNFPPPSDGNPSLLSLTEANTLFHEFGHALHGLLSDVTYPSQAGTNVPRDYVEFPSQVMENWMAQPEVLRLFAKHHQTGEPMPDELIEKIQKASNFNQGFLTGEYLAAAWLDMKWHTLPHGEAQVDDVRAFEKAALNELGLPPIILPRYRSTYFAHIFAGGYSAGYYAYLWSEVLDADAFEAFQETDLFDQETAAKYRALLAAGGSQPGMDLYRTFRGRDPEIEPLLKKKGLQ